ncbi:hypothetical protein F5Y10DRAFT_268714 [Nemania abortiva]|nr:hypothetical protein F5Y10DRAFT_268714 [Nemania abortiva]
MVSSRFFDTIPLELRREIYTYLPSPDPTSTTIVSVILKQDYEQLRSADLVYTKEPWTPVDLNVLRVCKRAYDEALPILYRRCIFNPTADSDVITAFFSRMSSFARSSIRTLLLKPQPQALRRVGGPNPNISELRRVVLWGPACKKILTLLPDLKEVQIHLPLLYAYEIESDRDVGWLTVPLSFLQSVKKSLVRVSRGSADFPATQYVEKWDRLIEKEDSERAALLSYEAAIMNKKNRWTNPYWRMKRSGFRPNLLTDSPNCLT